MRRRVILEDLLFQRAFQRELAIRHSTRLPEPVAAALEPAGPAWFRWAIALGITCWLTTSLWQPIWNGGAALALAYYFLLLLNAFAVAVTFVVGAALTVGLGIVWYVFYSVGMGWNFQPIMEPIAFWTLGITTLIFWKWLIDVVSSFVPWPGSS